MNRDHYELLLSVLPALALGLTAGWYGRRWWDAGRRAERVVGGVRELHPRAVAPDVNE